MIKYPNKKSTFQKEVSYANRGMRFEEMINETNDYYLVHDIAVIHKKPIPIQIVKVDYPSRQGAVIKEAYYKVPSTTDYNGIYKGIHIDFEAKETNNKTSFPIKNIHPHQIDHLVKIAQHGGIAFVLIHFRVNNEIYLLEAKKLKSYEERSFKGRKSIQLSELQKDGYLIKESYAPRVDYLDVVKKLIKKQFAR